MEDVFDDSVLSLPSSSQVVGGSSAPGTLLSQEGGAGKVKKVLIRKKYKWTDKIRCGCLTSSHCTVLCIHIHVPLVCGCACIGNMTY